MSRHQNARQDDKIKIANRSFENMAHLKYIGNDCNKAKFDS
jgi:hypothetical protein